MAKIAPKRDLAHAAGRRQVNRLPLERRIADILLAARDVFTEKGYQDALISDIADRAGVVEGSIYAFSPAAAGASRPPVGTDWPLA